MRSQEDAAYNYEHYIVQAAGEERVNVTWREKIVHWSYNVVDHFDLSREVVAISLDLFDRFLATLHNKCNGNLALLTSLTTLHLAIKLHDTKRVRMSTLANLSRGQFGPPDIEDMEWCILSALKWRVHPPTAYSYVYHLLLMLPPETSVPVRKDLLELSRYITELTVCDSYFIDNPASNVAMGSILHVMDEIPFTKLSAGLRERFLRTVAQRIPGLHASDPSVLATRLRIAQMLASANTSLAATSSSDLVESGAHNSTTMDSGDSTGSYHSFGSNGSSKRSLLGTRVRSNSTDSKGSCRSFRLAVAAAAGGGGRRVSSHSPIVAGVQ